jgi:hypothetical protein
MTGSQIRKLLLTSSRSTFFDIVTARTIFKFEQARRALKKIKEFKA